MIISHNNTNGSLPSSVYGPGTALNAAQIVTHLHICFLSTYLISLKQNAMSKVKQQIIQTPELD